MCVVEAGRFDMCVGEAGRFYVYLLGKQGDSEWQQVGKVNIH